MYLHMCICKLGRPPRRIFSSLFLGSIIFLNSFWSEKFAWQNYFWPECFCQETGEISGWNTFKHKNNSALKCEAKEPASEFLKSWFFFTWNDFNLIGFNYCLAFWISSTIWWRGLASRSAQVSPALSALSSSTSLHNSWPSPRSQRSAYGRRNNCSDWPKDQPTYSRGHWEVTLQTRGWGTSCSRFILMK